MGCHCENGDLVAEGVAAMHAAGRRGPEAHPHSRPPLVEAEAVGRWLAIGEMAGCPVNIVHLSTRRALELVRAARARGQACYVETCPQYLLLDEGRYALPGFESAKFVLSPPLRAPGGCARPVGRPGRRRDRHRGAPTTAPLISTVPSSWDGRILPRSPTASPVWSTAPCCFIRRAWPRGV